MDFLPRLYEVRWAAFVQMIYFHLMNRDEQKRWLWMFSTALSLPDSVNEIVFVYSWLRLAFSRQDNLSLHDWLDSCLIHATWKCLYSSVYCGFPQRSEENRWGPHADSSSRAPVSLRQRIQSPGTKCACLFVFLLPPRDVGFTPQTTLAATRPYKSLQRCTAVVTPLPYWLITPPGAVYHVFLCVRERNERRDAARGMKTWRSERGLKCQQLFI